MRLTPTQIAAILDSTEEVFGEDAKVALFGSRLDDHKRGGDIDLLIETPEALSPQEMVTRRSRFMARLWRRIGERKIDVVISALGHASAEATFVQLVQQQVRPLRTELR